MIIMRVNKKQFDFLIETGKKSSGLPSPVDVSWGIVGDNRGKLVCFLSLLVRFFLEAKHQRQVNDEVDERATLN